MTTGDSPRPVTWTGAGPAFRASTEFGAVSRATLRLLRQQLGHDLWMLTRVDGDTLVVVDCLDYAYGLRPGVVLPWTGTLDWMMVHGHGPRAAPQVSDVPAYADLGLSSGLRAGSYLGVPLLHEGELFGTLTGLHPTPLPETVAAALPLVESLGEVLGAVVGVELRAGALARRAARAEADAHVDPLTQLGNRLAWTKVLAEEELRCRRYDRSACVVSVDLDGLKWTNDRYGHEAGDRLLRSAALVLRRVSRMCDQVARVGGDEFAVLAVEAGEPQGRVLLDRLTTSLAAAGVDASLGLAVRTGDGTLEETWHAADAAMYRDKRRRLQERVTAALAGKAVAPRARRDLADVPSQQAPASG